MLHDIINSQIPLNVLHIGLEVNILNLELLLYLLLSLWDLDLLIYLVLVLLNELLLLLNVVLGLVREEDACFGWFLLDLVGSEDYHGPADLHCDGCLWDNLGPLVRQDESAKLRLLVLEKELAVLEDNLAVAARHTDVMALNVAVLATSQRVVALELDQAEVALIRMQNVDHPMSLVLHVK